MCQNIFARYCMYVLYSARTAQNTTQTQTERLESSLRTPFETYFKEKRKEISSIDVTDRLSRHTVLTVTFCVSPPSRPPSATRRPPLAAIQLQACGVKKEGTFF